MNRWIGIGRITKDPELRHAQGGDTNVCSFTLAVDRKGQKGQADFISCKAFGRTAEFVDKYFSKGMKMVVEGRIQTGSYTNKNGDKVYTTDVIAENIEFCENKKQEEPKYAETERQQAAEGFMNIADELAKDGLPFI